MKPADPALICGRTHRVVKQDVTVSPHPRRESGMEFITDRLRPGHCDRRRKQSIHAAHPGADRTFSGAVKMHHLPQCVHARIRATRADGADRHAGNARARRFQPVLHGATCGLGLPAAKTAAVVFNAQNQSQGLRSRAFHAPEKRNRGRSTAAVVDHATTCRLTE